jgi:hypothetical protein
MICFLCKHTMSLIWIFVNIFPQFTCSAETCESFLPLLFELTDVAIEAPAGSPAVDLAVGLQKLSVLTVIPGGTAQLSSPLVDVMLAPVYSCPWMANR